MGGWLNRRTPVATVVPQRTRRVADVIVFSGDQPIVGAEVYLDDVGGGHTGKTDAGGGAHFELSLLPQSYVRVKADGYQPYEQHLELVGGSDLQIRIGLAADPARTMDLVLPGLTADKPMIIGPELHGRLRSNGPRLVDDVGPWKWKMATAFDALRLLITGGEDALVTYLKWVLSIGGNGLRVFGNWQVTGLDFRQVPEYFPWLDRLCALTFRHGVRVEFCAICDHIPEGLVAQQAFVDQVARVLARWPHVTLTFGNEPYQNMEDPQRITPPAADVLMARGMCNPNDPNALPYLPSAGFTVYQTVRSDDWMRKVGKDGYEIRSGFSDAFRGTHDACINTEMMGAAETYQPGRRSNRPDEFFMAGVAAAMFTSGATAHGDSLTMQRCVEPGPVEASCAAALFRGIDAVPIDAPTWEYCRPGLRAELMPVETDPLDSLDDVRIHAMVGPTQAVSINYRYLLPGHDAWKPKGINGWRTLSQDGCYVLSAR